MKQKHICRKLDIYECKKTNFSEPLRMRSNEENFTAQLGNFCAPVRKQFFHSEVAFRAQKTQYRKIRGNNCTFFLQMLLEKRKNAFLCLDWTAMGYVPQLGLKFVACALAIPCVVHRLESLFYTKNGE